MNQQAIVNSSLEGVVVGETSISNVDGQAGLLSYRGLNIETLVNKPQWDIAARLSCPLEPSCKDLSAFSSFMRRRAILQDHERGTGSRTNVTEFILTFRTEQSFDRQ